MQLRTGLAGTGRKHTLKWLANASVWALAAVLIAGPAILHSQAGIGISPILTGSMRPSAEAGDVYITQLTPASEVRVGDVISVYSKATGVFYAHRVVEIRPQSGLLRMVTKGDANGSAEVDPYLVGESQPVSKRVLTVKWLGYPLIFLTSVQGRQAGLALIVIANVIALFLYLFRKKAVITDEQTRMSEELQLYREFTQQHISEQALADFLRKVHLHRNIQTNQIKESI